MSRKAKARTTSDMEAVIGTLLIGKRLLSEGKVSGAYPALDTALTMSAPKDAVKTWWAARYALVRVAGGEFDHLDIDQLVGLFDTAGHNVAKLNTALKGESK
jgi:hypothetical protein